MKWSQSSVFLVRSSVDSRGAKGKLTCSSETAALPMISSLRESEKQRKRNQTQIPTKASIRFCYSLGKSVKIKAKLLFLKLPKSLSSRL